MDESEEVAEVIRAAFAALQGSHPEVLARISSALDAARREDSNASTIEAAFRDAAKVLLATDAGAAQTLFTVAETLAEISTYWGSAKDSR
jgi:hypothetical protein